MINSLSWDVGRGCMSFRKTFQKRQIRKGALSVKARAHWVASLPHLSFNKRGERFVEKICQDLR